MPPLRLSALARLVACPLFVALSATAALPEPPRQHDPWTPPAGTALPRFVLSVTASLFDAGLADPRGGEYRQVVLSDSGPADEPLRTHAWVFPQGYAVGWNGMVYRLESVGPAADLQRDVRTIVKAKPWSRLALWHTSRTLEKPKSDFWSGMHDDVIIAPSSLALLLRLGRMDLAELLWRAREEGPPGHPAPRSEYNEEQWIAAASESWFGSAYRRLVAQFERGQDRAAADLAEALLLWRTRVPAQWIVRDPQSARRIADLSFLDPVQALLADAQRRLHEPAQPRLDLAAVPKGAARAQLLHQPQAERIAYLIARLEDVHGEKVGTPGPLIFAFEPVVELLKEEGDAAVEPLLDALEQDHRLTRAFDYSRPWNINYTPVPTSTVIQRLLGDIFEVSGRERNPTPAELRAMWERRRSRGRLEASFDALADDHLPPERWLRSAEFLTQRSDVRWMHGAPTSRGGACQPGAPELTMPGEPLRARQNPSVSDLLEKRIAALVAAYSPLACRIAVLATLWDAGTALPALRAAAELDSCRADPLFTVARLSAGDSAAAADWSAALRALHDLPQLRPEAFAPLWIFPENPVLQETALWLFAQPDSPLSPGNRRIRVHSALLAVPAFRQAVFSALNDESLAGTAKRTQDGRLSFEFKDGGGGGREQVEHDRRQAAPGGQRPFRVKDWVAFELTSLEGAPEFGLDWNAPDKDVAILQIAKWLRRHEAQIKARPTDLPTALCPGSNVYLQH